MKNVSADLSVWSFLPYLGLCLPLDSSFLLSKLLGPTL